MMTRIEEALKNIDETYCMRLLEEMLIIPSVIKEERQLIDYLLDELNALGFKTRVQQVEGERANLIAKHNFKGKSPMLMFNGHVDTVPVCEGWSTDPFDPSLSEGKLFGLGSLDMKAGIACQISAIKALMDADLGLHGSLVFTAVVDEEGFSKGAKKLLESDVAMADAVMIGEPASGVEGNPIPLGITGKILYELIVKGRAAHGFKPELGVNAVEEAARIIVNLDKLELKPHPHFGEGNYCTLKMEGGYNVYSVVVPDRARIEVNRLLVPGETFETAIEDMKALVQSLGINSEVEIRGKPPFYKPFELDENSHIIRVFKDSYEETNGFKPKFGYLKSVTDGNVFTGEGGIPSVHFGPQGGGVHQPDEYVYIDSLKPVIEIYVRTAEKFLSDSNDAH